MITDAATVPSTPDLQTVRAKPSAPLGAIAALVDRLDNAGHLERVAKPKDRRCSLLRTKPSGRDALAAGMMPPASEADRIAAGRPPTPLACPRGSCRSRPRWAASL